MNLKGFHFTAGIATVVVFLATGLYMRMNFPDLYAGNQSIRFLFRANHVYILFSGLLNTVTGLYLQMSDLPWKRTLQTIGSWSVLVSSPLFLAAFIVEPIQASPMRPVTITAAFAALIGVTLHLIASRFARSH